MFIKDKEDRSNDFDDAEEPFTFFHRFYAGLDAIRNRLFLKIHSSFVLIPSAVKQTEISQHEKLTTI